MMNAYKIKPNYSDVARQYNLDRHTVKKYFESNGKVKRKITMRKSKFDVYEDEIKITLEKVGVTMISCMKYLENKYPNEIVWNYSSFKSYVAKKGYNCRRNDINPHVRYETPPGEQLQVDWKESIIMTSKHGERFEFNIFSATLGYSRLHIFVYSKTKTTDDFIRCLIEVLNYIGGKPQRILTDNMTAIVSINGNSKKKHSSITQLEKDLGINIELCKVRSPETKGKCESANRFIDWLKPYDNEFIDENELIEIIKRITNQCNSEINQTTSLPPLVLFNKEKEYLTPLPNKLLLDSYISNVLIQEVPTTQLVKYKGHEYSVPKNYINKRVRLVPINDQLYIYYNTDLVAIHDLSNNKFNYDKNHYIDALSSRIKDPSINIEETAISNLSRLDNFTNRTRRVKNKYGIRDRKGFLLDYHDELVIIGKLNPTPNELYELDNWIKQGNTFYDNPLHFRNEDGSSMNFIEAIKYDSIKFL